MNRVFKICGTDGRARRCLSAILPTVLSTFVFFTVVIASSTAPLTVSKMGAAEEKREKAAVAARERIVKERIFSKSVGMPVGKVSCWVWVEVRL